MSVVMKRSHCAWLTCQAQIILWSGTIFNTGRIESWTSSFLYICLCAYHKIGIFVSQHANIDAVYSEIAYAPVVIMLRDYYT